MNVTTEKPNNKVLFIAGGPKADSYTRALEAGGYHCEIATTLDAGMARIRDAEATFDLLVWDAETQGRIVDEAFDRGRFQVKIPTLLLLDRAYPFLETEGRRPGVLDYLVRPLSAQDVVVAAEQNVRLLKAKRYVALARKQLEDLAESLARCEDMMNRTQTGVAPGVNPGLPLSERELEVARALARGHRVTQIARMYRISPHTVRNHFKSIFRKLQVHSQVELLARLREELR